MLLLTLETLAFGVAVLAFLTIIGLGITEYLLPVEGMQLLLAPAVGLAALMLGFQWLSIFVPPFVVALVVAVVTAPLTALFAWRRRAALLTRWRDLAGAGAIAAVYYVAVLQVVILGGALTLGSFPGDHIF